MERATSLMFSLIMLAVILETSVQIVRAYCDDMIEAFVLLIFFAIICITVFCYCFYKFINSKEDE